METQSILVPRVQKGSAQDADDGRVVLLTMPEIDKGSVSDFAYVLHTTDTTIWFCFIHPSSSGQNTFGVKMIPRAQVEATPLAGSGSRGLLHHWFAQETDEETLQDSSAVVRYRMDRIHDPQNRNLLERFLAASSLDTIFALLTQSVSYLGLGHGNRAVSRTCWQAALHWRERVRHDRVLAAREKMVEAFLRRESPLRLAQRVNAHLETFVEENVVWLLAVPFIGLAWEVLRAYSGDVHAEDYRSTAMMLLEHALDADLIFQRSPLYWIGVTPLPGMHEEHLQLVKESVILDLCRSGWHDVLRLRYTLTAYRQWTLKTDADEMIRLRGQSEAFYKIGLSEMRLSEIWLKKWEQTHDDTFFHVTDCPSLTPFERARIKDALIQRLTQLNAAAVTRILHRQSGPWYKLFNEYDQRQVLCVLTWRLQEESFAVELDDLHQQYPLPPPVHELVQKRLSPTV